MKNILYVLLLVTLQSNAQVVFPIQQALTGTTFWVKTLDDFPTPIGNVITLVHGATYQISRKVDLQGNRIVCNGINTIVGSSSESQSLFSTGLDTTEYLITSDSSISIKDLTIDHNRAFSLVATGADQVLDWIGVNVINSTRSQISGYENINFTGCAFLNSSNFILDGTVGTFAVNYSFMDANVTPVFYFQTTFECTRRVRMVYSSFFCTGSECVVHWLGTIPAGQFIIKDCNFSGGGTYLVGISSLSTRATFHDNTGITNTLDFTDWDKIETDDFSGDYADLTNKPTTFPSTAHTHLQSEVTNLVTDLANKQSLLTGSEGIFSAWDKIAADDFDGAYLSLTGIPTSFTPTTHNHAISEVTGLQTALNGKFDTPTGTTAQYVRGDGTLATLPSVTGESTTVGDSPTLDLTLTGTNITGSVIDGSITPAKLSQTYLTAEVDGSVTNEIQTITLTGNSLSISGGNSQTFTGWDTDASNDFGGAYSSLTGIPSTFAPSAHTHAQSEITGLVTDLSNKEPIVTAGTTSQYYRGDKTFQTLNATSVGLGNVDDTADLDKPISTATQTALNSKLNNPAGTTAQYIRGDGSIATLPIGEVTTVSNTSTVGLTMTGVNITADVLDGSITPAKLSQAYDPSNTNEIQTLSLLGTDLTISAAGGNTVAFTNWDTDVTNDLTAATNFVGDITGTIGATNIAANVVTTAEILNNTIANADLVQMPANTIKANLTAGTANATDATINDLRLALGLPANITLTTSPAFNTVAPVAVTGMSFTGVANTSYKVEITGAFRSAATTTGIGLALDIPAGGTVSGYTLHPTSATISGMATQTADNAVGATTGVAVINTDYPITASFLVNVGATGGLIQLTCRSEIAASAVTLQANQFIMQYSRLN